MAKLTYREMWETYIEPVLKAQEKMRKDSEPGPRMADDDLPVTLESRKAEAAAMGMMFGHDPLEVAKAVGKSWPPKQSDFEELKAKLLARERKE